MATDSQIRTTNALASQYRRQISRQRIDYAWQKDGRIKAILTLTLAGGQTYRITAHGDPYEIAKVMQANNPEVGSLLGKVWGGIKKVAKKVATSKVFKAASSVLTKVGAALPPPVGPAALAAGTAMSIGTKLLAAKTYSDRGDTKSAAKLVLAAKKEGEKHPPTVEAAGKQAASKLYTLLLKPA